MRSRAILVVLFVPWLVCCDGSNSADLHRDFIVDVLGERFVMRTTGPATMEQAVAILNGAEQMFPSGPLRRGEGGFNAPWSWHLDPDDVRLTEVAVEVCDARPSYVE